MEIVTKDMGRQIPNDVLYMKNMIKQRDSGVLQDKSLKGNEIEQKRELMTKAQEDLIQSLQNEVKSLKQNTDEKLLKMRSMLEKGGAQIIGNANPADRLISNNASELKALKNKQYGEVRLELKAADVITTTGNITPQPNAYMPTPHVLPGVNAIVHPRSRILDFVRVVHVDSPLIVVVNETAGEGNFNWTAEGAPKPQLDFGFKTETVQARKLAAHAKLSREMLDDVDFIKNETNRIMREKYQRILAEAVYNGNGTGENIYGLTYFAPGYTHTSLNGKIADPGLSEVLFASATQIRNIGFEGLQVAFVNPSDWAAEMTRKDADGHLLEMNKLLDGITVVPTSEVQTGKYLIGEAGQYTLYVRNEFTLTYGYVNDDFTKNLITIVAEGRVYGFVSDNNKGAFVADTVASVAALIAKS